MIKKMKNLNDLNSEEIMKLLEKPYIISELAENFNISQDTVKSIIKEKGIKNIINETTYRDLISLLFYIQYKYINMKKENIQIIIRNIINFRYDGIAYADSHIKKLKKINWLDLNYEAIIKKKNIDLNYRLNHLQYEISMVNRINQKEKKQRILDSNSTLKTYTKLMQQKKSMIPFSKDDLSYELLYQLSIIENTPDSLIGNIFNLTKNQVRYIRNKNNLQNVHAKRHINHPELFLHYMKQKGIAINNISEIDIVKTAYYWCKIQANEKNWNLETINDYFNEKLKEYDDINKICLSINKNDNYIVATNTNKHIGHKNIKPKESLPQGKKTKQLENAKTKINAGKLGEEIVYHEEINKLKKLGLENLANKVRWVTKTNNEETTIDGFGYDIISYNEKGEKIYIEVKCSTTNNSDTNIKFNISNKEVQLMQGNIKGIDKKFCYIYYIYKINKEKKTANKIVVDSQTFANYNLIPTHYSVSEIYTQKR